MNTTHGNVGPSQASNARYESKLPRLSRAFGDPVCLEWWCTCKEEDFLGGGKVLLRSCLGAVNWRLRVSVEVEEAVWGSRCSMKQVMDKLMCCC